MDDERYDRGAEMNRGPGLFAIIRGHLATGPFCAAVTLAIAACAVTPYGDGGGAYYDGVYEPYGYDYGYWGGDYRVGPPRGGERGGFRGGDAHGGGNEHGPGGEGGRGEGGRGGGGHGGGAPSIPQGARGGGGGHH